MGCSLLPVVTASLISQHPRVTFSTGLNTAKLRHFLEFVSTLYTDAPYHNAMHATQVVWFAHVLLGATCARSVLSPLHILALYVAAACHDVGHKCARPSACALCVLASNSNSLPGGAG